MKVRSHIALLVLAILAPTVVFSAVALDLLLTAERQAALRSMQELARASINVMDREMTFAMATAQTLSTSRVLHAGAIEDFYAQTKAANSQREIHAALIDENGQQLFNTVRPFGTTIPAPAAITQARVGNVIAGGVPVYSGLIKGSATGKYVVSVEYPVRIRDGRRLIVNEWMYSDHLNKLLPDEKIPPSWLIAVFDRQGITIARNKNPEKFIGHPPREERRRTILAGFEGIGRAYTRDGVEMYGAWERSSITGWTVGVGVPVTEIEKTAVQSVALTAAGFITALLFALGGAVLFSRRLLGAIGTVAADAELLSRHRIPPVKDLRVDEMNRLQLALHDAGRLLAAAQDSRQRTLDEARAARDHAEEAQRIAESQNQAKDEFLAMLGHELRNPLAAIASGMVVLNLPGVDADRAAKARSIIGRQTGHLTKLVDDLLDAHRILSGKIRLALRPVDLKLALEGCLAGFETRGAMRNHQVRVDLDAATIQGDPTRLEQMFCNLVDNALKYTPEGGGIDITLRTEAGIAVLAIADTGIGLAPELLAKAFEVFVQGKVVNRSKGGLGIGLAVVDALARQQGGTLAAQSAGVGQGSVFTLRFPTIDAGPGVPAATPEASAQAAGTVLVIEDNRDVREMTALMLTEHGLAVHVAENGAEGIALATSTGPDVALIDLDLPDMSGHDVAARLRKDPRTAAIRLIAVTGYGQPTDRTRALGAGFDTHLTKPVPLEQLIASIRELLPPNS
jgi:signal transduction histidine kinase/CheY-like chemotaxis protein